MTAVSSLQPSRVSPLLPVFLHRLLSLNYPLDPCSFALRLDGSGSPHPSSRTPPAPGSTSRQPRLSFAVALQAVRDLAAVLPQEEVPHFAHESQVHHQSSSTKQTPGRQMLSQDLLLLTQHPDCCTAPTSLCNQLLFGIRSSPAFSVSSFLILHVLPPSGKWLGKARVSWRACGILIDSVATLVPRRRL